GGWTSALVSVYATLYAAGVLATGFARRAPSLRYLALVGFGAVVVKVGAFDLASIGTPLRILITACLGVVLLVAAYAYARRGALAAEDLKPALDGLGWETKDLGKGLHQAFVELPGGLRYFLVVSLSPDGSFLRLEAPLADLPPLDGVPVGRLTALLAENARLP